MLRLILVGSYATMAAHQNANRSGKLTETMNRREFMTWVGVGSLASSLPVALAACNPGGTDQATPEAEPEAAAASPEAAAPAEAIAIGTAADLDAQGSLVVENPEKVIVVRDPADATKVLALTANCNHKNCTVEWKAADSTFVCPCHQSIFALDGTLQTGPATEPLKPLTATIEGDQILVSL